MRMHSRFDARIPALCGAFGGRFARVEEMRPGVGKFLEIEGRDRACFERVAFDAVCYRAKILFARPEA